MNAPAIQGIHHLKLAVSDLDASLRFYEAAFEARRIAQYDHRRVSDGLLYAYILTVPGLGTLLELRLNPERAQKHRLFDPISLNVQSRETLSEWDEFLTARGVLHSPVITATVGWMMVVEDPDGNRLRLFTIESHGPELKPDEESSWLDS